MDVAGGVDETSGASLEGKTSSGAFSCPPAHPVVAAQRTTAVLDVGLAQELETEFATERV
jgi:hypothetical protein